MRYTSEISHDGPYVRVLLPDVLPPDWDALRRQLDPELDEGASRVMLIIGECAGFAPDDPALLQLIRGLQEEGIETMAFPGWR